MVRVTVKPYLQGYVRKLGEEWGTDDPTEIVNLLIFQHRQGQQPAEKTAKGQQKSDTRTELDELSELLN